MFVLHHVVQRAESEPYLSMVRIHPGPLLHISLPNVSCSHSLSNAEINIKNQMLLVTADVNSRDSWMKNDADCCCLYSCVHYESSELIAFLG